jgi:hypothetical protein
MDQSCPLTAGFIAAAKELNIGAGMWKGVNDDRSTTATAFLGDGEGGESKPWWDSSTEDASSVGSSDVSQQRQPLFEGSFRGLLASAAQEG